MDICYDTEFLEDGRTIDLISIGMAADDGREYYAVNRDMPLKRIGRHPWLMANVFPHLPKPGGEARLRGRWPRLDTAHPAVKPRAQISAEVCDFIQGTPDPALWAWYAAYDHVVLCQLWGPMACLPEGVPMFTSDLKQECARLGDPAMPAQDSGEHHALADARHVRSMKRHFSAWQAARRP